MDGFTVSENRRQILRGRDGGGKICALQMVRRRILDLQFSPLNTLNFAKALFSVVEKFGWRDRLRVETCFAGLDARQGEQILRESRHARGVLADNFQKLACGRGIFGSAVEQSLGVTLNRSERRAQFVGNVGDEVAAGLFYALRFGQIAQHGNGAPSGQRCGSNIEGAAGNDRGGACGFDFTCDRSFLDGCEEIGIANGFDNGLVQARALRNQAIHRLVGPLHQAIGADGDNGVLHAVEQSFELALAGTDCGETFFDAAGCAIDGSGDPADFILGSFADTGLQIAFGDTGSDIDYALEAASRPIRGDPGYKKSEKKSQAGSLRQPVANLRGNRFDIGKRVGQADSAAGDGSGHIEKRNADGCAAALIAAHSAGESRDEFRTGGVILDAAGIRFRIGENLALGIDDGDTGASGLSFLSGDVSERVAAIVFDPVSQKLGLFGLVGLNFGAQASV